MNWQLDLMDGPIHALQIVSGAPRLIAVWLTESIVRFYAVESGALYGTMTLVRPGVFDPHSNAWRRFIDTLHAPHGGFLPRVTVEGVTILTSYDGRLRLYWVHGDQLVLDDDGQPGELPRRNDEAKLVDVALDRDLGTVVALSAAGNLHLYQQHVYVGQAALGDDHSAGLQAVFAPDAGGEAVVVQEFSVKIVDLTGQTLFRVVINPAADIGSTTPSGNLIAMSDSNANLHIYDSELTPIFQGNSHSLVSLASPLQFIHRTPQHNARPNAIAIDDDGLLALAIDNILCCSHVDHLPRLPRPSTLL